MRPKKVILYVDTDEVRASTVRFILTVHGYRILSASGGQEAIALFCSAPHVELVLAVADMPQVSGAELVKQLKCMASHVPMVLLGDANTFQSYTVGETQWADSRIDHTRCSTEELLERIKVWTARKRGPRKGAQRVQPQPIRSKAAVGA